jgi:uncharacterized cupin superfamily protein
MQLDHVAEGLWFPEGPIATADGSIPPYESCDGKPLDSANDMPSIDKPGSAFTCFGQTDGEVRRLGALYYALADGSRIVVSPAGGRVACTLPGYQWLNSLAVEADGHVCVATIWNGGISVFETGGTYEHIGLPDPVTTNICFGGTDMRDAWVTCLSTGRLYHCRGRGRDCACRSMPEARAAGHGQGTPHGCPGEKRSKTTSPELFAMKKIDLKATSVKVGSSYPAPLDEPCRERRRAALGEAAGLSQFGVNLLTLPPGVWSSQRHWHSAEDEFLWVVDGEVVLVTDSGEEVLRAGDCAGFKAGVADGHHLQNRSQQTAHVLEVGSRRPDRDVCEYPDVDLRWVGNAGPTRKNGSRY